MSRTRHQTRKPLRRGGDRALEDILSTLANAMAETLESLVDRPIQIQDRDAFFCDGRPGEPGDVCVRGRLQGDGNGHYIRFNLSRRQVLTLTGLMMMTSDEDIIQRRNQADLTPEDIDTMTEVGNVLCSGIDAILRDGIQGTVELRFDGLEFVDEHVIGDEPHVAYDVELRVSSYPTERATILADVDVANSWTHGRYPDRRRTKDELTSPGDLPATEVRAQMACFVTEPGILEVVRNSCRSVGIELQRHGSSEAPNPTAHKSGLVLMDVPFGHDRRFDWCKRLKVANAGVRVLLLVHHPSRARVVQGLMAKADAILGWPVEEAALSARLHELLDSTP